MRGKYAPKMWEMLTKYGVESSWVKPHSKHFIGMEDLENELEAAEDAADNDENDLDKYQEEFEGMGSGIDNDLPDANTELDNATEDVPEDSSNLPPESNDGDVEDEDYGFGYQSNEYEEDNAWDDSINSIDDTVSEADAINMVKIITSHTNAYVSNIELIEKDNQGIIERTGDIKQAPFYNEFIQPANTILNVVFKDTDIMRKVNNFLQVIEDKRKMSSICGTAENPFLYEGIQLLAIELYKSLLAIVPFYVKNATSLEETISSMKLDTVNTLLQMAQDICDVNNMFGVKIFYVAPVVSDVTGKSEELAGTKYANLESCMYRPFGSKMMYAGESIMNLVEIKNNKALPEYSILSKMMKVISGMCINLNISETYTEVLEIVKNVLNSGDSEDAESLVYDACERLRTLVFIPQIEKIADMNKQEEAEAVGTDNVDDTPDDMSTITMDPGEEEPASESVLPDFIVNMFNK
jgi:hypothetical protein